MDRRREAMYNAMKKSSFLAAVGMVCGAGYLLLGRLGLSWMQPTPQCQLCTLVFHDMCHWQEIIEMWGTMVWVVCREYCDHIHAITGK